MGVSAAYTYGIKQRSYRSALCGGPAYSGLTAACHCRTGSARRCQHRTRVNWITFEKDVVIADLRYRDLPDLKVLWLDNNHESDEGTSDVRWGNLSVPQRSHSTLGHVGDDVRGRRRDKNKRERKDGLFATSLSYMGFLSKNQPIWSVLECQYM